MKKWWQNALGGLLDLVGTILIMYTIMMCLMLWLLSGCAQSDVVQLSDAEWAANYEQMTKRMNVWFWGQPPQLPTLSEMRSTVTFRETDGDNCYHLPESFTIEIPSNLWHSGCVPHELGHAALHMIGHPCAPVFEHPPNPRFAPLWCF